MSQPRQTLEQIFEKQVQTLSLTLRPFTVVKYQYVARYFVGYLRETFPEVRRLSQLRRDPHMLGWFRWLCELRPPVGNHTRHQRLLCLRRLLNDLAFQGHPVQPGLILPEDLPVRPQYLPRPMSPEDDRRLQEELRRADTLYSNALLLTPVTESVLENVSTCLSIVGGASDPSSGHCTFPSESFTLNAWYPSIRKDSD